jgi:chromosome segregation ATPase
MEEQIANLQAEIMQTEAKVNEKHGQIAKLEEMKADLMGQLESLQNIDLDNKQKLV